MTPEDSRPPRRGNGHLAASWVRLTDLDPVLAEHLLEVLGGEGIAAYASPVSGHVGGYLEVRLPDRPTDRLYVDPQRLDDARELVRAALAEHERETAAATPPAPDADPEPAPPAPTPVADPPPRSDDEEWAGIVAMFQRGSEAPVAPWPVSEDVDDAERESPQWPAEEPRGLLRRRPRESDNPLDGPREELEDLVGRDPADDDHYVAPPPPPVPRAHPAFWGAILAILLGLVLMVRPELVLGSPSSNGTFGFGILLVMVGSGVLVWRLHDGPPTDSGPEDGAVV